ncbi:cytochrome 450 [Nodosilinea sp. FACHB-131]|uniref:cytochrome 450 n=1 Tax=Cyanophyceae TaxID=3028117 RepID=UPI001688CFA3|nr:cytochrome 450 [Nodosilinea sp. FACHB-131]MBD1877253.1 cytochrome 450 [Nodosilinea sp. FACHB-131]
MNNILNNFQTWAIQYPEKGLSKTILPLISLFEGLLATTNATYLHSKRQKFGSNFCCSGQVVLGDFETLKIALTSPQARTWRLGTTLLDAKHSPNQDVGGRNVFLLSLSDQAAGGSTDHAAFKKCMQDYLLNETASARQRDPIARGLLEKLAADYKAMPHSPGGTFFTDEHRGLMQFMIRYLHYVIFGLNPDDDDSMRHLTDLYYTRLGPTHYIAKVGRLLKQLKLKGHGDISDLIEKVATLYEQSPVLANFQEARPEYNHMTRRELAKLMTSIMSIAALQGPLHIAYTSMGFRPLPAYGDRTTANIDLTQEWDTLDLEDRHAVRLFLLECARLWAPVNATHRIATEAFTVTIAGKAQTFPAGTNILIPIGLGLLDESIWGSTTYEFNANRENLCPFHMGFHSVGDHSAERICPGKEVALDMLVDILITVGKVRRTLPPATATTGHAA